MQYTIPRVQATLFETLVHMLVLYFGLGCRDPPPIIGPDCIIAGLGPTGGIIFPGDERSSIGP